MKFLSSLLAGAAKAAPVILGNAFARTAIGGAVSAALALIGLHLSPDAALSVIGLGATLAGLGPHVTSNSDAPAAQ